MKTSEITLQPGAIIEQPYPGYAQTLVNDSGQICHHTNCLSMEDYNGETGRNDILISWEEYDKLHKAFFERPFEEISEDQYNDMLECLPPLNWHNLNRRYNIFFCSEAMSGLMNGAYILDRETDKYYAGTIDRLTPDADIIKMIEADLSKEVVL